VFYGTADLGPPDGLPTRVRVFYPSVEGSPAGAPIVAGCGRYPLVAFLHGQCLQTDHYLSWNRLPALLARSGYVVVVPALQSIPPFADPNPEVSLVDDVVRWMRSSWVHRGALLPPPMTAVVGHSWGALLGASVAIRLQAQHSLSAFASLSGGWTEWPPVPPLPLRSVMVPSMFMWGTGDSDNFSRIGPGMWDALQPAKHKVVFTGGEHWDYLRSTPCGQRPGPCNLVASLAADFLLTFLSHYLPPERWSLLRYTIPHSLVPPPLQLTQAQEFFAGGHLAGFAEIENSQVCRVRHTWDIPLGGRGTVSLPFRWTSPWFPWPW
jgi:pimeloyl-ACP methyl ester carboxylesterase